LLTLPLPLSLTLPLSLPPFPPLHYDPAMPATTTINPAVAYMDESIIRDMTRVAEDAGAVNLAQGFPELPLADSLREAAVAAIRDGHNQYTRTWGDPVLRARLSSFLESNFGLRYDAEDELVVTCGASEAIMATLLTLLPRGAGVVIPEPIYENYLPAARLAGATPHILSLDPFTGAWDAAALDAACATSAVLILNTPANPQGKVWRRDELEELGRILRRHDTVLVTDETYAFITAPGQEHVAPATIPGLYERTVTIASFSKTYAVTGWRVGFAAAPAPLMASIRKVHDFLTVCAPAGSQRALVAALDLPASFYADTAATYHARGERLRTGLEATGWRCNRPQGTYFLLLDVRDLGIEDDRTWSVELARTHGVAGVPGSAFLWDGLPHEDRPSDRRGTFLRLSFGKSEGLIDQAIANLSGGPTSL
jgi:aspartate/methionine/tyrosine aminotransferase